MTNVVSFPRRRRSATAERTSAFDDLTVALIMERHRRGELDPAIVAALLQGCGFNVEASQ
jgi:hypothetical protein